MGIIKKSLNLGIGLWIGWMLIFGGVAKAEPQFGGKVDSLVYCNCNNVWWLTVGAPHGGSYIKNNKTKVYDCEPLRVGEWILGMATEETEVCLVHCGNTCCVIGSGDIIDYYGSSDNDCGSKASDASLSVAEDVENENSARAVSGSSVVGENIEKGSAQEIVSDESQDNSSDINSEKNDDESEESDDKYEENDENKNQESTNNIDVKKFNNVNNLNTFDNKNEDEEKNKRNETKGESILNNLDRKLGAEKEVILSKERQNLKNKSEKKGARWEIAKTTLIDVDKSQQKNNGFWRMIIVLIGFGLGSYFIGRAGNKLLNK